MIKIVEKTIPFKQIRFFLEKNTLFVSNNVDEDKLDMDSQFRIGSISKLFTMLSIFIAQEQKKIKLTDYAINYLNINENKNKFKKITILDILEHKSGLKRNPGLKIIAKHDFTMNDVFDTFKDEQLFEHKYGDYNYSNVGYIVLGVILENIYSGISYAEIIKINILDPLKMINTKISIGNIKLYTFLEETIVDISSDERAMNEIYFAGCAGGYLSTTNDLLKFVSNFKNLIKPTTLKKFTKLYPFENSTKKEIIFKRNGTIKGGSSNITAIYDLNFKLLKCYIELKAMW